MGGGKMLPAIAVLVVVLVVACAMSAVLSPTYLEDETTEVYVMQTGERASINLTGDFGKNDGDLTASVGSDEVLNVAVSGPGAGSGSFFQWTVFDRDHPFMADDQLAVAYEGYVVEGELPSLSLGSHHGAYSLSVRCFDDDTKRTQTAEYSGKVIYSKPVEALYEWEYDGTQYSLDIELSYSSYVYYKEMGVSERGVLPFAEYKKFITPNDPVILDIASKLRTAYGPNEHNGIARFVLSFVQTCFDYPPHTDQMSSDEYMHGSKEYFAYPLETLFNGGDCEDTSILLTSIYAALDMRSALVFLPNHVMSGVYLDGYTPVNTDPSLYEAIASAGEEGFFACETTVEHIDVGIAPLVDIGGHPYSYYIGAKSLTGDRYGFYEMGL
jgi:hypothetical protein